MDIHSASQARANLFKLLEQVNQESKPCIITSRKGDVGLFHSLKKKCDRE